MTSESDSIVTRFHEGVHESLTFKWLSGLAITIILSLVGYVGRGILADQSAAAAERQDMKNELAIQKNATALKVQALELQLSEIQKSQEREHKLLVKIAARMGIEAE